ncbi:MAG: hypothetical protein V1838_01620 [Patescibacteria group bacterium]
MFDTSKDVLFLVIALAVAILTFFGSWLLYYLIKILKRGYNAVNMVTEKIETLSNIIDGLKEKLDHSASAFTILSQAILKLVGHWKKKSNNKKGKSKNEDDDIIEDF